MYNMATEFDTVTSCLFIIDVSHFYDSSLQDYLWLLLKNNVIFKIIVQCTLYVRWIGIDMLRCLFPLKREIIVFCGL